MYKQEALPKSIDRWRIVAEIQTASPLHIGDGDRVRMSMRDCVRESMDDDVDPDYASVFTGHGGKPYLPATSIKGALRAWATAHRRSEEHTSELQSPCNLVCRLLLEKSHKSWYVDRRMKFSSWREHFFFNDTATTEIYTLSLHDALPI